MKTLLKTRKSLEEAGRWDIDFHLPPEHIRKFREELICRVDSTAEIIKDKRDPTKRPDQVFQYIDISSIDVASGLIANPQELTGAEAPSRARKVVRAFDIIISTCRPTRGAIAVIPVGLHNQIASTAFSIVRAKQEINPYYLQFALRQPSTLEQFRKWSTGSSYPAILDEDVEKTLIPVPDTDTQDEIAKEVVCALVERERALKVANFDWEATLERIRKGMYQEDARTVQETVSHDGDEDRPCSRAEIHTILSDLPNLDVDVSGRGNRKLQDATTDLFEAAAVASP